ncbi:MAG: hypothetical protein AB7O21_06225 [Gammaproteobacteria bacterium]
MRPCRVTIETASGCQTASYVVRGMVLTVTSRELGQESERLRLLSPTQLATVLLWKLAFCDEDVARSRPGDQA